MNKIFFISGIDTNSGKTIITGLIAKYLLQNKKNSITQKLVQTGCVGIAEDIRVHRKIMGVDLFSEDLNHITCPFVFGHPSSPELSASLEGKTIDLQIIQNSTKQLLEKFQYVLLEGVGGLMVPLTKDKMVIDFIKENSYDLFLVSSPKLGSINHTLLSIETCYNYKIKLKAVIYNNYPVADKLILENSRNAIKKHLSFRFPDAHFIDIPEVDFNQIPNINFEQLLV